MYPIVSDIAAAGAELIARDADVSEVFHPAAPGAQFRPDLDGHASERSGDSYSSFVTFDDPDGNRWLLQEVTTRLPVRIDAAATSFGSVSDVAGAAALRGRPRRAREAHR